MTWLRTVMVRLQFLQRPSRIVFFAVSWVFVLALVLQLFTVGLSIFVDPSHWADHQMLANIIGGLTMVLTIAAIGGQLPLKVIGQTLLLILLFGMQYTYLSIAEQIDIPAIAALHPVNALAIFWLALILAGGARTFVTQTSPVEAVERDETIIPEIGRTKMP